MMEIQISDLTEGQIQDHLDRGDREAAIQLLVRALSTEEPRFRLLSRKAGAKEEELAKEECERLRKEIAILQSWGRFDRSPSVEELANAQGIGPIQSLDDLACNAWPEGESVEDFVAAAKGFREPVGE